MAQISRGHHTVPRFYLQSFADDRGFVNVVRLPGDIRYPQSVAKVSVVNDFYNIGSGPERDAIETLIADGIERPAAAVLRKVLADGVWPLEVEDRSILTTYIALQQGRGANKRQSLIEMVDFISEIGGSHGLPDDDDARAEAIKRIHIETMLDFVTMGPYFFGRIWTLVKVDGGLLTCDTPISLLPFNGAAEDAGLGIGTAEAIMLPLSRTTALMMAMHPPDSERDAENVVTGVYDKIVEAGDDFVETFNRETINNARHSLFHHPGDSSRVPPDLPSPRATEIATAPVTFE